MPTWRVTDREILALWNAIWPKIVAIAWLDEIEPFQPGFSYRNSFEQSSTFRQNEVRRIAGVLKNHGLLRLDWTSQIPISVASPGQFGIQMPTYVRVASCLYTLRYPFPAPENGTADKADFGSKGDLPDVGAGLSSAAGGVADSPHAALTREVDAPIDVAPRALQPRPDVDEFAETALLKPLRIRWSCPNTLFGNTFFYINHWGIVLPWPPRPSTTDIFVGYMEGGGLLPRAAKNGGPPWMGSKLIPTESHLFSELTAFPTNAAPQAAKVLVNGLVGTSLLTLFEKWGEVIGAACTIQGAAAHIRSNLRSYIMPEVWTTWPDFLEAAHSTGHTFILEGDSSTRDAVGKNPRMKLTCPVPAPVDVPLPAEEEVFRELIIGQATNPMYSNCY